MHHFMETKHIENNLHVNSNVRFRVVYNPVNEIRALLFTSNTLYHVLLFLRFRPKKCLLSQFN